MTKKLFFLSFVALFVIGLSQLSCENNNELDLYGEVECDTIHITWESDIAEILQNNCVICHGPETAYKNVRHDSYEAEMVVVNDGRLRGVVNHLPGYIPMPYDSPKLNECDLKKINIWLDNGAPEN
ncbi:MAG: hypothetical protein WD052_04825, partial [Bacteroidales bacterium]